MGLMGEWGPGGLDEFVRRTQSMYFRRAGKVVEGLAGVEGLRAPMPGGGMFLWIELEGGEDFGEVMDFMVDEGVGLGLG